MFAKVKTSLNVLLGLTLLAGANSVLAQTADPFKADDGNIGKICYRFQIGYTAEGGHCSDTELLNGTCAVPVDLYTRFNRSVMAMSDEGQEVVLEAEQLDLSDFAGVQDDKMIVRYMSDNNWSPATNIPEGKVVYFRRESNNQLQLIRDYKVDCDGETHYFEKRDFTHLSSIDDGKNVWRFNSSTSANITGPFNASCNEGTGGWSEGYAVVTEVPECDLFEYGEAFFQD